MDLYRRFKLWFWYGWYRWIYLGKRTHRDVIEATLVLMEKMTDIHAKDHLSVIDSQETIVSHVGSLHLLNQDLITLQRLVNQGYSIHAYSGKQPQVYLVKDWLCVMDDVVGMPDKRYQDSFNLHLNFLKDLDAKNDRRETYLRFIDSYIRDIQQLNLFVLNKIIKGA